MGTVLLGAGLASGGLASGCVRPVEQSGAEAPAEVPTPPPGRLTLAARTSEIPAPSARQTPVARYGQLAVRGAQLVDAAG